MSTSFRYAVMPVRSGVSLEDVVSRVTTPPGFVVQLAASELPPRLDLTFAAAEPQVGPQSLVVLGPRPEWLGRLVSPAVAREVGLGEIGESVTADRLLALTELVVSLSPAATAVIQPMANHMACTAADFARDAESYLASKNPAPLWAYPRLVREHGASYVETTGMGVFGLPELALPVEPGRAEQLEKVAHALMRAMVDGGPLPVGATARASSGEVKVEAAIHGALWCVPAGLAPGEVERARGQLGRRRALSAMLGPHTHLHFPGSETRVAKEHFSMQGQSLAMTNGASERAQPGGAPEQRNQDVELVVRARELGPWANGWLDWAAEALHAHPAQTPLREFDRVVLATPQAGIAGVLLWPFGHLLPEGSAQPPVHLWILLPLTPEEVERFRANPQAQHQWIQEREARRDVELVEQRWTGR